MAVVRGCLGQLAPSADTETDLYTVPANKNATVRVIATNRSTQATIRITIAKDGDATENKQYIAYEQILAGNDSVSTAVIIIGGNDVIRVRANSANVSFCCSGIEQDD
mgnify:CR=1 FL=1